MAVSYTTVTRTARAATLVCCVLALVVCSANAGSGTVQLTANGFLVNGQPTLLRSTTLQWFRLAPEEWEDRIVRVRSLGYNMIDMYLPWNLLEVANNTFLLTEQTDFPRFLRLMAKYQLFAYVRPGPYITNEMDGGGVPAWLLPLTNHRRIDANTALSTMNPRTNDRAWLNAVEQYYSFINPLLVPFQFTVSGGPVLLYSVENEYNFASNVFDYECNFDLDDGQPERPYKQNYDTYGYLSRLRQMALADGITVPLTTCPGSGDVQAGAFGVPGIAPLPNFYSTWVQHAEQSVLSLLDTLHSAGKFAGDPYLSYPAGSSETSTKDSQYRRFFTGGMDLVSQFNGFGALAPRGRSLNTLVMNSGDVHDLNTLLNTIAMMVDLSWNTLTNTVLRLNIGFLCGHNAPGKQVSASGQLRIEAFATRRTNAFLSSFEWLVAPAGSAYRSVSSGSDSSLGRAANYSVRVLHPQLGSQLDTDTKSFVSYWLPLPHAAPNAALVGVLYMFTNGALNAGLNCIAAFGETFPRYAPLQVPTSTVRDQASARPMIRNDNATGTPDLINIKQSGDDEYLLWVPVNIPLRPAGGALGAMLDYATCELLEARDVAKNVTVMSVYSDAGVTSELRLSLTGGSIATVLMTPTGVAQVQARAADGSTLTLTLVHPMEAPAHVDLLLSKRGSTSTHLLRILVLNVRLASTLHWLPAAATLMPDAGVLLLGAELVLEADASAGQVPLEVDPATTTLYTWTAARAGSVAQAQTIVAKPAPPTVVDRPVARGAVYARADTSLASVVDGWNVNGGVENILRTGSRPKYLDQLGIYNGFAFYRAVITLSAADYSALRDDSCALYLRHASDFVSVFVNGRYLLTLTPVGTEIDSASSDSDYGFHIPRSVLAVGTNVLVLRVDVWGHGDFAMPMRGRLAHWYVGSLRVPLPTRLSAPAMGWDAMKGISDGDGVSTAQAKSTLCGRALGNWSVTPGLSVLERAVLVAPAGKEQGAQPQEKGWTQVAALPLTLSSGEVRVLRFRLDASLIPDPKLWRAPLAIVLNGTNLRAEVFINGTLIGRWLSDQGWMRRGGWHVPSLTMWNWGSKDDTPLPPAWMARLAAESLHIQQQGAAAGSGSGSGAAARDPAYLDPLTISIVLADVSDATNGARAVLTELLVRQTRELVAPDNELVSAPQRVVALRF